MRKLNDNTHTGAASELLAAAWLINKGYAVFRNVAPSGMADLIMVKDGVMTMVDVTTGGLITSKTKEPYLYMNVTKARKGAMHGVKVLYVNGGDCYWHDENSLALVEAKCGYCGTMFEQTKSKSRFCSYKCRTIYWGSKNKQNRIETTNNQQQEAA